MSWTACWTRRRALLDDAVDLRRRLHRRPELGLQLPETQAAVLEALDGLPVSVTTGTTTTSVVAVLDGDAPGPTVSAARRHGRPARCTRTPGSTTPAPSTTPCTRAGTTPTSPCSSAPPGCSPIGAVRFAGRVAFMFQPGEEGHHGARYMLDEGLLEQVGTDGAPVIDGLRPAPVADASRPGIDRHPGPGAARLGRHAAGHGDGAGRARVDAPPRPRPDPDRLRDRDGPPVDGHPPGRRLRSRRRHRRPHPGGHHRQRHPRDRRAPRHDPDRVGRRPARRCSTRSVGVAEGIAAAHGAEAEVDLVEGYPVTVNDDDAAAFALDTAARLLGEQATVTMPTPIMGAEDWSYVLQQVPGAMAFLGTGPGGSRTRRTEPLQPHGRRRVGDGRGDRHLRRRGAALARRGFGWLTCTTPLRPRVAVL